MPQQDHRLPAPPPLLQASFNWIGFLSAMGSNLTFQSRNVLSKKLMVKKVRAEVCSCRGHGVVQLQAHCAIG
jgi:hypothetical protein